MPEYRQATAPPPATTDSKLRLQIAQKSPTLTKPGILELLERETRLELATPTLARLCSTN